MINEIKTIVHNYLNSARLCNFMKGTVEANGIRVSEKLVIPDSVIVGNRKSNIKINDKVYLLRKQGGQQFYILEVISE